MSKGKKLDNVLPFPLLAIAQCGDKVLVSGGGGGKKFGMENKILVYAKKPVLEKPLVEHLTNEDIITSFHFSPKVKNLFAASAGPRCRLYTLSPQGNAIQEKIAFQTDFALEGP